ncbi:MAG: hypothetical protein ACJATT_003688 [Myxococcota bacterium]|jgi:hypothetical protein
MKRETLIALVGGILGGFGGAAVWGQYAQAQDIGRPVVCEAASYQRENLTEVMQRLRDAGYDEFLMVPRSGNDARRGTVCAW